MAIGMGLLTTVGSIVVGGVVGGVTVVGLVSNTVDSPSANPADVSSTTIDYGSR